MNTNDSKEVTMTPAGGFVAQVLDYVGEHYIKKGVSLMGAEYNPDRNELCVWCEPYAHSEKIFKIPNDVTSTEVFELLEKHGYVKLDSEHYTCELG